MCVGCCGRSDHYGQRATQQTNTPPPDPTVQTQGTQRIAEGDKYRKDGRALVSSKILIKQWPFPGTPTYMCRSASCPCRPRGTAGWPQTVPREPAPHDGPWGGLRPRPPAHRPASCHRIAGQPSQTGSWRRSCLACKGGRERGGGVCSQLGQAGPRLLGGAPNPGTSKRSS